MLAIIHCVSFVIRVIISSVVIFVWIQSIINCQVCTGNYPEITEFSDHMMWCSLAQIALVIGLMIMRFIRTWCQVEDIAICEYMGKRPVIIADHPRIDVTVIRGRDWRLKGSRDVFVRSASSSYERELVHLVTYDSATGSGTCSLFLCERRVAMNVRL